jgi:MFS family permease
MVAMAMIWARLHLPVRKTEHRIDFLGAGLLSASAITLLLATVWGGSRYAWDSSTIISLIGGGLLAALAFVGWERKAKEPIIPMRLFKNDIFTVSTILSLLAGMVMFAAFIYLPEYQQLVHGYSATKSGLMMLPLIFGLIGSMTISGRLISKTGHYRMFPIVGTAVTAFGLWLFSHVAIGTSQWLLSVWMLTLGVGIGLFMQVMTLAIQNSVDRKDMGTATSVATFFRTMGSSFGTAIFGAILTVRLNHHLHELLPGSPITAENMQASKAQLAQLPPNVMHGILEAFVRAFHDVFIWAIPFAVLTFIVALFLRETPLKTSTKDMAEGEGLEGAH